MRGVAYSVCQEGIYVGYRYYETRYGDVVMGTGNAGSYDYASTVAYPFGYGLSYTGIPDAGDYYFTAAKGYTVENTAGRMTGNGNTDLVCKWTNGTLDSSIFAASSATGNQIVNLFDNADPNRAEVTPGAVTWLTRSDWNGTFPKENIVWAANDAMVAALQDVQYDPADYETVPMPTMVEDNGLTLAAMIGKSYDDPDWDLLLNQLTFDHAGLPQYGGDPFHRQGGYQGRKRPAGSYRLLDHGRQRHVLYFRRRARRHFQPGDGGRRGPVHG